MPESALTAVPACTPVLDTHIHLFDPTRPGGIPWPTPADGILYQPALPARYAALAMPHGVVGAIAVEASARTSDNDWLLHTASAHPLIVGVVANLDPAAHNFFYELDRLRAHPLLVGIRSGNLWRRNLSQAIAQPATLEHLAALSGSGLAFDTANPDLLLLEAVSTIGERISDLRIILDHLPAASENPTSRFRALLARLGQNPNIYVKLSEIPRHIDGAVPRNPDFYRPTLDAICSAFDEDHILFGSDWPHSDRWLPYDQTFTLVRDLFSTRSPEACRKFFHQNSVRAYRWRLRG